MRGFCVRMEGGAHHFHPHYSQGHTQLQGRLGNVVQWGLEEASWHRGLLSNSQAPTQPHLPEGFYSLKFSLNRTPPSLGASCTP